jgi:hypothetical protein
VPGTRRRRLHGTGSRQLPGTGRGRLRGTGRRSRPETGRGRLRGTGRRSLPGTCWGQFPVAPALLAGSAARLAAGRSPHQNPAATSAGLDGRAWRSLPCHVSWTSPLLRERAWPGAHPRQNQTRLGVRQGGRARPGRPGRRHRWNAHSCSPDGCCCQRDGAHFLPDDRHCPPRDCHCCLSGPRQRHLTDGRHCPPCDCHCWPDDRHRHPSGSRHRPRTDGRRHCPPDDHHCSPGDCHRHPSGARQYRRRVDPHCCPLGGRCRWLSGARRCRRFRWHVAASRPACPHRADRLGPSGQHRSRTGAAVRRSGAANRRPAARARSRPLSAPSQARHARRHTDARIHGISSMR